MSVRTDQELLLSALDRYQEWHTPGFLAGKGLISLEWSPALVNQLALDLELLGLAETRYSQAKRQLMFRITASGIEYLHRERALT